MNRRRFGPDDAAITSKTQLRSRLDGCARPEEHRRPLHGHCIDGIRSGTFTYSKFGRPHAARVIDPRRCGQGAVPVITAQ